MRNSLAALRAESQRLDEENLIAQAFLDRVFDVLFGDGTSIEPDSGDATWNDTAREYWENWWWTAPEVRGLDAGGSLERKLLRHYAVDGDLLVLLDDKHGQIQAITADQIGMRAGSRVGEGQYSEMGVILDELRRIVGFDIFPFNSSGQRTAKPVRITDMERAVFFAHRRRIDQTRGEPMGQASFPMLHRVNDMCDGYAAAAQLLSRIAVAINKQGAAEGAFHASRTDTKDPGATGTGSAARRVLDIGYALMFFGEQGDKVEGIDRKTGASDAVEMLKFFMRLLGMPYGLSLEFTLMIWSDTNYASGKASLQQVQRNGRPLRNILYRLYDRVYPWRIAKAIEDGELPDHPRSMRYKLKFPGYPLLDPTKERAAQSAAIVDGLSSPQREVESSTDTDWKSIMKERADAYTFVQQLVTKLNAAGVPVRIEDFIPRADFTSTAESVSKTVEPTPAEDPAATPPQPQPEEQA